MILNRELRMELEQQYHSGNIFGFPSNHLPPKYYKLTQYKRPVGKSKYSEEFKLDAVRQVVNLGYSTSEVANRLGISVIILYIWVKLYSPTSIERYEAELKEIRRENYKLKAVLRRTQDVSENLKNTRCAIQKNSSDLRLQSRYRQ